MVQWWCWFGGAGQHIHVHFCGRSGGDDGRGYGRGGGLVVVVVVVVVMVVVLLRKVLMVVEVVAVEVWN